MEFAARTWTAAGGDTSDDSAALIEALHARHARRIYNLALRYARDAAEAEDLTQDVFVRALEKAHRIDPARNPDGWLMRLAVRVFLSRRGRSATARPAIGPLDEEPIAPDSRGDRHDGRAESLDTIRHLLGRLPAMRRLVFLLFYYESRSIEEVAALTGLRPSSVQSHLKRGRRTLREHLQVEGNHDTDREGRHDEARDKDREGRREGDRDG